MFRQLSRHSCGQTGGIDLLDDHLIERTGEIRSETHSLDRLDRIGRPRFADQAGENQLARKRIDGRRDGFVVSRIEERANAIIQFGIPDRDQSRQQQTAFGATHEGVGDCTLGAIIGQEYDRARQCQPVALRARQQPGSKRIGEAAADRDIID